MASFEPRAPYTAEELTRLYPEGLQLQLVQVLLRHGERTPVSSRFQKAGLSPFWPYCAAAKRLSSVTMTHADASGWDQLEWKRHLETFTDDDEPVVASGPQGQVHGICIPGELTDKGRASTLALGQRLRHLYVDQLRFMPEAIKDASILYLRTTPVPRALESMQQTFWGMYPAATRAADFPVPMILTRAPADETLFLNDGNCRRFAQLSRAFATRAASRWNESKEMDYLNSLLAKWMPDGAERVAVDSAPRLSGIMDTISSTQSHGPGTRLPKEFYDPRAREIIDRIAVEEWYAGFQESTEYRMLGIGGLLGDMVSRMVGSVEGNSYDGSAEVADDSRALDPTRPKIRFGLSGCHDTTLAATLTSLGAFEGERWPPFTSHIAMEMFRQADHHPRADAIPPSPAKQGWWPSLAEGLLGWAGRGSKSSTAARPIARRPMTELDESEQARLQGYFVRIRYNDRPMVVPGCRASGKHFEGDESFCTLTAFKEIVDKFTPKNWRQACMSNVDEPLFPVQVEPAGV
ncbi:MAG: hypothetical protein M1826_007756 [Phylliscum demangeonii]|nr:MAG: hypothetical protein M1826_007756 [Phylliscum demangeonii]